MVMSAPKKVGVQIGERRVPGRDASEAVSDRGTQDHYNVAVALLEPSDEIVKAGGEVMAEMGDPRPDDPASRVVRRGLSW
jgi:hypothetical protein